MGQLNGVVSMPDRSYSGEPLDGSWQDIQDRPYKGEGETVGGTSEADYSEVFADTWPEAVDANEVRSDLQAEIIRAAALWDSYGPTELAEFVGCEISTVSKTLHRYWPDRTPEGGRGNYKLTPDLVDPIRRELLSGKPSGELASEYNVTNVTIGNVARGDTFEGAETDVPPLRYDHSSKEWRVPDDPDVLPLEDILRYAKERKTAAEERFGDEESGSFEQGIHLGRLHAMSDLIEHIHETGGIDSETGRGESDAE